MQVSASAATAVADHQPIKSPALRAALALLAYLASQWLAFGLTIQPENISIFWPPAGVMFACLVLAARRDWPLYCGLFLAGTLLANAMAGRGVGLNLVLSVNDVGVGALGAWIFHAISAGSRSLAGRRDVVALFLAATLSAVVSATVGAAAIHASFGAEYLTVWKFWSAAMVLGITLVAPPFLVWSREDFRGQGAQGWIESSLILLLLLGVTAFVFVHQNVGLEPSKVGLLSLPLLVLIWLAVSRPRLEATLGLLMMALLAIWDSVHWPATGAAELTSALWRSMLLHAFLAVAATSTLFLAVMTAQARNRARQLADSEAYLHAILNAAPSSVITIDEFGTIGTVNRRVAAMFGYEPSGLIAKNIKMLMPREYRERHDDYLARFRQTGERRIIGSTRIVAGQRRDGSIFPVELSVAEMPSTGPRHYAGFIRDITLRQSLERQVHELQDSLAHAARLNTMGEFAAAMAHELKQPLAAVTNYTFAAKELAQSAGAAPDKLASILEKAAEQAIRAGDVIRRIRSFIEKRELERREVNIHEVIEETLALAMVGARHAQARIAYRPALDLPRVSIDRVQIQQVLLNLIRNALDAMAGSATRLLTVECRAAGPDSIEIDVADTGPGIAPDAARKLFEPFFTTKPTGMGIGLSICRGIVEQHGGKLSHHRSRDGGALFRIRLPIAETRPDPDAADQRSDANA